MSDITKDEFLTGTLSVWEIPPESAKKVGHPAPFPVGLAKGLYLFFLRRRCRARSFVGSGTTAVAAKQLSRIYVGYDISREYCDIALERLNDDADGKDDSDGSFCHSGLA